MESFILMITGKIAQIPLSNIIRTGFLVSALCFIISRIVGKTSRENLKLILFLLIFLYGLFDYFYYFGISLKKFVLAFHDSITSFLSFQPLTDLQKSNSADLMWDIIILRISALFFIIYLSFSFLAKKITNNIKLHCYISFRKKLHVFWGVPNKNSMLLAELAKDKKLFRLPYSISFREEDSKLITQQIEDKRAIWIFTSKDDWGYEKGNKHYFMDSNAMENVKLAGRLIEKSGQEDITEKKIFIFVSNAEEEKNVMEWANKQQANKRQANKRHVNIRILNNAKLLANHFIEKYPVFQAPGIKTDHDTALIDGEFNILIIGFGERGRENLKAIVCNSQFYSAKDKKVPLSITVLTDDEKKLADYKAMHEEAIREYGINFDVISLSFAGLNKWYESSKAGPQKYNRIIICTDDDENNIAIGRHFDIIKKNSLHIYPEKTIFIEIEDSEIFRQYKDKFKKARLTLFGDISKVYEYVVLMDDRIEKLAKMLAFKWNYPEKELDINAINNYWLELDFFRRENNRFSAMGQYSYLKLLGYKAYTKEGLAARNRTKRKSDYLKEIAGKKIVSPEIMEILARINHERWAAYHYMQGIKKWSLHSLMPKKAKELCADLGAREDMDWNLIAELNMHAGMCSFEELPELDLELDKLNKGETGQTAEDFMATSENWQQPDGTKRENSQAKTYSFIDLMQPVYYDKAGLCIVQDDPGH